MSADGSHGYSTRYPDVTLHAICRDTDTFPAPCVFAQLAGGASDADGDDGVANGTVAADDIRLQPSSATTPAGALDSLFAAICECQEMHPDPAMGEDGSMGGDAAGYSVVAGGSGEPVFSAAQMAQMARLEGMFAEGGGEGAAEGEEEAEAGADDAARFEDA